MMLPTISKYERSNVDVKCLRSELPIEDSIGPYPINSA